MTRRLAFLTAVVVAGLFMQAVLAADGIEGRYRIELLSGQYVEGDVTEQPDGSYKVKTKQGVMVVVKKSEVRAVRPLAEAAAGERTTPASDDADAADFLPVVSEAAIEKLLDGILVDSDVALAGAGKDEMLVELPVNEDSLEAMKRIAGPKGKVLLKPHFVLLYTSEDAPARGLAARLESIYRWKVQFLRMLNVPAQRPDYKLEIFYFGTYDEYMAKGAPEGSAGYFSPDDNRSYFFDTNTHPFAVRLLEQAKDKNLPPDRRQRIRARVTRFNEDQNLEVVQHETGHHLDFNVGLFPFNGLRRKAGTPRWLVEGTTMLFEVPPNTAGASLGVMNSQRLDETRAVFGKHPLSLAKWTNFLFSDMVWFNNEWGGQGSSYPLGWSMVYYLWSKHRPALAKYYRAVYERDDDAAMTAADCQAEFEACFGRLDDKWIENYYKFLDSLQVKKSHLRLGMSAEEQATGKRGQDSGRRGGGQRGGRGGGGRGG